MSLSRILPAAALAVVSLPPLPAQTVQSARPAPPAGTQDAKIVKAQKPSYPLTACPISGKPLADTAVDHVVNGRLVRLCCEKCIEKADAESAAVIRKIDEAVIAQQKPGYPMTVSPVSGEKLGDKAVDYVHGTRLVRLAGASEVPQFEKDPAAAMQKVDRALIEAQVPRYTLKTCVVSGEPLGGEMGDPVDYLYGTRLVRFCCKTCIKQFEKEPEKYVKELK